MTTFANENHSAVRAQGAESPRLARRPRNATRLLPSLVLGASALLGACSSDLTHDGHTGSVSQSIDALPAGLPAGLTLDPNMLLSEITSAQTPVVHTRFVIGHEFKFGNDFKNNLPADITTSGLCGGMVYAALDYFNAPMAIPEQNFRPAAGTTLEHYLYNRDVDAVEANLDHWAELGFNPGGARNSEFFSWGLQGTPGGKLAELRAKLDQGIPAVLGLKGIGNQGDHQVLAVAYAMGHYSGTYGSGNEGDLRISVYDPNYPGRLMNMMPDTSHQFYTYADNPGEHTWLTYFVDQNYHPQTPPTIPRADYPQDGKIHELLFEAHTGGDDLRGSGDDVFITLQMRDGSTIDLGSINEDQRWIDDYTQTARKILPTPLIQQHIQYIILRDNFGGGISGDNWNMDSLDVKGVGYGGFPKAWHMAYGAKRFTGDDQVLTMAPLAPQLPPPVITSIFPSVGSPGGGSTIRISGNNFDIGGTNNVFFGFSQVSANCESPLSCYVTAPPGTGVLNVAMSVDGIATNQANDPNTQFSYVPSILDLSEHAGSAGDALTIQGIGLSSAPGAQIWFGPYQATVFSCSPTSCTVTVPPGAGQVDVRVTMSGDTSAINYTDRFTYAAPTITKVDPPFGSVAGGKIVTITGTGFDPAIGHSQVLFGGVASSYVNCDGTTSCEVRSPPAASTGNVDVTVVVNGVASLATSVDTFRYDAYPHISGLYPSGQGGYVTLDGAAPAGGAVVSLTSTDPNVVPPATVTIPAGAYQAGFTLTVLPSTTGGEAHINAAYEGTYASFWFTYLPTAVPPSINLTLAASALGRNMSTTGTITLGAPAPAGGAIVSLTSSTPTAIAVPASVSVAAGSSSTTFTITNTYGGSPKTVNLTATYQTASASASIDVPSDASVCQARTCAKGSYWDSSTCRCVVGKPQ